MVRSMSVTRRPNERRAGDELAVDRAVVRLVGVAGDERVDLGVEVVDDVDDRAGDPGALVVRRRRDRRAALVDQHDDRLDALRLELGDERVDRLDLVEELEAGDAGRA